MRKKGEAAACTPIKYAFMPRGIVLVNPAHDGLMVPSGFATDLRGIFADGDFVQRQKTFPRSGMFVIKGDVPQKFWGLAPVFVAHF